MKKRLVMALCLTLVLTLSLLAAGRTEEEVPGVTDTEIKIGTTQAMSGPVAIIGTHVADGLQAYFHYVNKNGGVHGRQINLIVADDAFNPANTVVETRRLVESDNVFAIVAPLGTPCVLAVMDYLNDRQVPMVYAAAGANPLSVPPKQYIFPFQPNYLVEGNIMVRYLAEELGKKRIGVIYRNAEDGRDGFASAKATIESLPGVELVADVPVDPTATDFSAEITRLQRQDPDAVIAILFSPQNSGFMMQATEFGFRDPLFLFNYATPDPTVVAAAGADVMEGVQALGWLQVDFEDPNFPAWEWYMDYKQTDNLPNAFATAGMLAAELFTEAVRSAGENLTREKLVEALENMDDWSGVLVEGATYKPFDVDDHTSRLGKQSMYPLVVKNGTWQIVGDWVDFVPVE